MTDDNPYSSPIPVAEHTKRLSVGRIAVIVLLTVLMIPAAGIAFFVTCFGVGMVSISALDGAGGRSDFFAWLIIIFSLLMGAVAAGAVVYGTYRAMRAVATRPVETPSLPSEPPPTT